MSQPALPLPKPVYVRRPLVDSIDLVLNMFRWLPVAVAVGIMAGSASALLLVSLAWATDFRENHIWIVALLPLAGLGIGALYWYLGRSVDAGNNLILDEVHAEVHDPNAVIPFRMTPLILFGTFVTHLFGGSAGREGTAIQTGASLADQLCRPLRMTGAQRRVVLLMGISAGFASVFGTPLAGTVFSLEVLSIGAVSYEAIAPCVVAAFVGDMVTHAWGVRHVLYAVDSVPAMSVRGLLCAMAAGIAFGLMAMLFAKLTHAIQHLAARFIAWPPLRPFAGGAIVAAAVFAIGTEHTRRFLGLGIPEMVAAFHTNLPSYDFAAKTVFTSITLGMGFKGGEVTPLFFIGATLGNALSHILPLPPSLLAGMGFVAVFAGAANTPIASTLMAVELFGAEAGAYAGVACVFSYLFSGHSGIYTAQRVGQAKLLGRTPDEDLSLAATTEARQAEAATSDE